MSSISVFSWPWCSRVILRPKMVVILSGWPMVRLASRSRSPSLSRAARRWKTRLSQNSVWAKKSRCWQPACSRSAALKNGVNRASHFWPQVTRSRGINWSASSCRRSGLAQAHEGIRALAEVDAFLAHLSGQPMMLVEADPRGEWQVGAHAHEHAAPSLIVDVEVVLNDPTLGELQVPTVDGLVADGDHDAGRFARLQHDDDLVGFCPLK